MATRNKVLKSKLGIEFEFKNSLLSFLTNVLSNVIVEDYDVPGNTPALRESSLDNLFLVGSSMGFEYKVAAYNLFALVDSAVLASEDVAEEDKELVDTLTSLVSRYVGLEGDGDFHFMVAVYRLAEAISQALDMTDEVTPYGPFMSGPSPEPPADPEPEPPADPEPPTAPGDPEPPADPEPEV